LIKKGGSILVIFIQAVLQTSFGQVVNNDIHERFTLVLDAGPITSATNFATVEWECINKSLTNKCLTYHNDQWFRFRVQSSGKYYLNLSSQHCRDSRGLQAVVIEGNPCEISTYKILHCIPQILQQDVFIALDSMKSNVDYLLNIDGFLGDYCTFKIALSSAPQGFSFNSKNLDTVKVSAKRVDDIINLTWSASQSLVNEIDEFEIYRIERNSKTPDLRGKVLVETNTVGVARSTYFFSDSLVTEGNYVYEIVGRFKQGLKQILNRHSITFAKEKSSSERTLEIFLDYKNGTNIRMLLLDKKRDQILKQSTFEFIRTQDANQKINVKRYLDLGITNFIVRVINLKTHRAIDYEFDLTNDK
jgi:hypothetical protein